MLNTSIGKYTITRKIGEGGMASVYEARHERLGTKVAIKILSPILARNPQLRQRFENEANFMASLSHSHITRVLDVEEQDDTLAIIMELLEGEDLDARVKRTGPLSTAEVKMIFTQVLNAFDYAHSKGIVHRDIKPANIFIDKNNQVKILDFGIAKLFGTGNEMTQTGTQMGTPVYMSPEQVRGEKSIDHRSDIYSLGVTLYFTLTGKAPYESAEESSYEIFTKIINEPIPNLVNNPTFDAIIQKAVSKDRNARYQAVGEMRKELEASGNPLLKTAAPISDKTVIENFHNMLLIHYKVPPSSEKTDSTKKIVLAIAVGVGLIGIISLIFINSNKHGASSEAYGDASSEVAPPTTEVVIGTQTWMTYNLDVTNFRNGEEIPEVKSAEEWRAAGLNNQAAWCYYDNDASNGAKYGKLYNWYAVNDPRGLAPLGWHIPTDAEWTTLSSNLGGEEAAGNQMKSSSGWLENGADKSGNGNDSSGFSGLPGGNRDSNGNFSPVGSIGSWWSASEYDFKDAISGDPNGAWYRELGSYSLRLYRNSYAKANGKSVRCVRD
jgi:uncharacterized protein (TIGR02145 family)